LGYIFSYKELSCNTTIGQMIMGDRRSAPSAVHKIVCP
jgi:hypothetical protein